MQGGLHRRVTLRIVRAVERGSSIRAAVRRFAVSPSAAIKLMQRVRATGSAAPARCGGHRRLLLAPYEAVRLCRRDRDHHPGMWWCWTTSPPTRSSGCASGWLRSAALLFLPP
jgi:transposase